MASTSKAFARSMDSYLNYIKMPWGDCFIIPLGSKLTITAALKRFNLF